MGLNHQTSASPPLSEFDPVAAHQAVPVIDSPVWDSAESLDGLGRGSVVVQADQEHALRRKPGLSAAGSLKVLALTRRSPLR